MSLPARYHAWIDWIGDGTGLPDAILHIHAGLAVLLAVRLVSGRSLGTFIPFAAVVIAEAANELMDYLLYGMRWEDTLTDVANTLFWPLVISLAVCLRPVVPRVRTRTDANLVVTMTPSFASSDSDTAGPNGCKS